MTPVTRPPAPDPTDPTAPPTAPPTVGVVAPAPGVVVTVPGAVPVAPSTTRYADGPARRVPDGHEVGAARLARRHLDRLGRGGSELHVDLAPARGRSGCPTGPGEAAASCATVVSSTPPTPWTACAATGPPATSAAVPIACTRVAAGTVWVASTGTSDSQATTPCARRSRGADTEIIARTTAGSNWVPEQRTSSRRAAARLTGRR